MDSAYYPVILRRRALPIIVILVIASLFLGVNAGWMYVNPETESSIETNTQQLVESEITSNATVTGNTSLYSHGENVRNKSNYLLYAMPNATLQSTTTVKKASQLEQEMYIRLTATSNGDSFWTERIKLDEKYKENGSSVTTQSTVNILKLSDRRSQVTSEVGGSGSVTASLVTETKYIYQGNIQTKTMQTPITLSQNTYSFNNPSEGKSVRHTTRSVTEVETVNTSVYLEAGAGLLLLFIAVIIGIYRYVKGIPSDWEIEVARHEEWLSRGKMMHIDPNNEFELDSISSVVDMAIDLRKRALYDPRVEAVLVMDDTMTAYYVSAPDSQWTPNTPYNV